LIFKKEETIISEKQEKERQKKIEIESKILNNKKLRWEVKYAKIFVIGATVISVLSLLANYYALFWAK